MGTKSYIDGMLERTFLFYDRTTIDRIRNTVFAISGLGGVGAITAELLARWGIKKFRLLDKDRYDPSNLNRQLFATSKTLGQLKTDVAADRIREINPSAEVELIIKEPVDNENVARFLDGAGILIQSADSPSCQVFYRAAMRYRIPVVNGFSTITGCRVQSYDYRHDSFWFKLESMWYKHKWRALKDVSQMSRKELAEFDNKMMHPAMPTMNFITNIAGAMMVGEAIKLLTNTGRPVTFPKLLEIDFYKNSFKVRNQFSPLSMETLKKIFIRDTGKPNFQKFIDAKKVEAGVDF